MTEKTLTTSSGIDKYSTLTIHFPSIHCIDDFICRLDNVFDHSEWGEDDVLCTEYRDDLILFSLGTSRSLFTDEEENLKSKNVPRGLQPLMTKGNLFQHRMNNAKPKFIGIAKQLDGNFLSEAEKELLVRGRED